MKVSQKKDLMIGFKRSLPVSKKHQDNTKTYYDRTPGIFKQISELLYDKDELKILSYGCSIGLETEALADKYFVKDNHKILGFDINLDVIKKARKRNKHPKRVSFLESSRGVFYYLKGDYPIHIDGPFDVIFAMSVFCSWPKTASVADCSEFITFNDFNESVISMDKLLKKDGCLVIYNSNFYFEDTELFKEGYSKVSAIYPSDWRWCCNKHRWGRPRNSRTDKCSKSNKFIDIGVHDDSNVEVAHVAGFVTKFNSENKSIKPKSDAGVIFKKN